jgi:Fic family protein
MISNDIENLLYRFKSNNMSLEDIAEFHILFEKVHPFSDGNGRVGRLLMVYQAIQNDFVPPLIENDSRDEYLSALSSKNDLFVFLQKSISRSLDLIDKNHQASVSECLEDYDMV